MLTVLLVESDAEILGRQLDTVQKNKSLRVLTYQLCRDVKGDAWPITYHVNAVSEIMANEKVNVLVVNWEIGPGADYNKNEMDVVPRILHAMNNPLDPSSDGDEIKSIKEHLRKIIIRTYNPGLTWTRMLRLEHEINEIFGRDTVFILQLSSSFIKFDLQRPADPVNPTTLPVNNTERQEYENNFTEVLCKILKEIQEGNSDLFFLQFDALERIRHVHWNNRNAFKLAMQSGKMKEDDLLSFSIGHVTFISNHRNDKDRHLLDIPYKGYYELINQPLEQNEQWRQIYKDPSGRYLSDQYVFYDYSFFGGKFILHDIRTSTKLDDPEKKLRFSNFLPILHASAFYDETAWKEKVDPTLVSKTPGQRTCKLFFMFSRINNRSLAVRTDFNSHLNFSLWTFNDKNYPVAQVDQLIGHLMETYFFSLQDAIESSLQISYYSYINDLEEEKKKKEIAEEKLRFISTHQHTIRNFGYELKLALLQDSLEMNDIVPALRIIKQLEHLNLLRDCTIDMIYNVDKPVTSFLLYKKLEEKGFKITELLKMVVLGKADDSEFPDLSSEASLHPANRLQEKDIIPLFNLFVNLFSNATKYSSYRRHRVDLFITEEYLHIAFISDRPMPHPIIDYLLGHTKILDSRGAGMPVIRESLTALSSFIHPMAETGSAITNITLKIYPK